MNENRYSDSLAHYGVKGMQWGVRRVLREKKRSESIEEIRDRRRKRAKRAVAIGASAAYVGRSLYKANKYVKGGRKPSKALESGVKALEYKRYARGIPGDLERYLDMQSREYKSIGRSDLSRQLKNYYKLSRSKR